MRSKLIMNQKRLSQPDLLSVLVTFCADASPIQNTASTIVKHILFLIFLVLCKNTLNFPFPKKLFPLYNNE